MELVETGTVGVRVPLHHKKLDIMQVLLMQAVVVCHELN